MSTLQDIEEAVRRLPPEEMESLERWFYTQVFPRHRIDFESSEGFQVREPAAVYGKEPDGQYMSIDDYRRFEATSPLRHEIESPKLVIEVLSPSTERSDRREKALNYRQIPSVEEFVLVAQHRPEMTIYRRGDHWKPQWLSGEEAVAEFRSIALSVPLRQIFEGIP